MARCCASSTDSCSCVIVEGAGVDVSGEGTFDDPYVVAIEPGSIEAEDVAFDPAGSIAASDVQAAIEELDTEKAPLANPVFTGDPQVPTATLGDNTDSAASTQFVQSAVSSGMSTLLTPTITNGDTAHAPNGDAVFDALAAKAPLANPAFTGNPTVPTAAFADNDTSAASTAFVVQANGYINKAADESVAASTTLQSDDHLTFSAEANAVYEVAFRLYFLPNNNTNGGYKIALSVPASATVGGFSSSGLTGSPIGLASDTVFNSAASAGTTATGVTLVLSAVRVITGATAGTVALRWAQNTASNTTTLKAGSYMLVRRLA